MLLYEDIFEPRVLSEYARDALRDYPDNQPSLARWLPYSPQDDLEFRFFRGENGLMQYAPYRTWDTESSISGRKGVTRQTGEMPPISRKRVLSEYDRLRRRANPDQAIEDAVLGDVEELVAQIAMTFEIGMGDALVTGTITPPGLNETVDFGRSSSNSVTANVYWTNYGSSDPLTDLVTWARYYRQKNGVRPGVILMSEDSLYNMLQSQALRALASTLAGTPTILDLSTLNAILARNGLPPIEVYEVQYAGVGGAATRVIPNNVVLLLPAPVDPNSPTSTKLGATMVGSPAESDDPRFDLAESRAGLVAGNYTKEDPPQIWTKVAGIGIPILANADLSMKARVAA
jgi:hypothetical protein